MELPSIRILPQPDGSTCGPTCLQAVYDHYGDAIPLARVIAEVAQVPTGGTLAVMLACHALRRGYDATIYTYNLQVFDPTWFELPPDELPARLHAQMAAKQDARLTVACYAYLEFLRLGGRLAYRELSESLLAALLAGGRPVLTGLSATYRYGCARERDERYDDVAGEPMGHFVLLCDYDTASRTLTVADPLQDNPRYGSHYYRVSVDRLIGAVLLGIVTYDANLLVIEPRG